MHFAASGSHKAAEDGRRKCESSTFAIAYRHFPAITFTFGVLRRKRFRLLTFLSSFCPILARASKSPNYPEALPRLFLWENSPVTCLPGAGFKSAFRSLNFAPHPFILSSRNT